MLQEGKRRDSHTPSCPSFSHAHSRDSCQEHESREAALSVAEHFALSSLFLSLILQFRTFIERVSEGNHPANRAEEKGEQYNYIEMRIN